MRASRSADRTDVDLLLSSAAGDGDAFGVIYQRHHDKLRAAAARVTGIQDAEDALQDGMIKAYRQAHQFKGDSQVSTWLYRIVVNAAKDLVRRRKVVAEPATEAWYPDWQIRQVMRRLDIKRYWGHLSADQQEAVWLTDVMDYSAADAAAAAGVSQGTIKSRVFRGRQLLARYLYRPHCEAA